MQDHVEFLAGNDHESAAIKVSWVGADPGIRLEGADPLPGRSNYFFSQDPATWRTDIPQYGRLSYINAYPGIDVTFYGHDSRLEYDMIVQGHATPRKIRLKFTGAKRIELDADGDLVLKAHGLTIRQKRPVIYQMLDGVRKEISGRYKVHPGGEVTLDIGSYDTARALVIDPSIVFSSYLGGNLDDIAYAVALDPAGNAYVTGYTGSSNLGVGLGMNSLLSYSAFVTKISADGSAILYSVYFGGNSYTWAQGIAVDASGSAYVTGWTRATDFPVVGGVQSQFHGGRSYGDAFVTKISPAGNAMVYSTFLGGSDDEQGHSIAVDGSGSAYVVGWTKSADFPTVNPLPTPACTASGTFLAKLNPAGNSLTYATYVGGENLTAVAVDATGSAYVTGFAYLCTISPTLNAFQTTVAGSDDAFVTKVDPSGSTRVYSTYFGGSDNDLPTGIAVDSGGNAYVTGRTLSVDFPVVAAVQAHLGTVPPNAFFGPNSNPGDAFITKVNAQGTALVYSTYLGGAGDDWGSAIAVDGNGNAFVGGTAGSYDFPTVSSLQTWKGGDAFAAEINSAGTAWVFVTLLGGTTADYGNGVAVDSSGNVVVVGGTGATDFPTLHPFQASLGGPVYDAFVTKLSTGPPLPMVGSATFVKTDTTTHGNWPGVYGSDGYIVVADSTLNPGYVSPAPAGQSQAAWTNSTSDIRALKKPSNPSDRIAGVWFSNSSFTVDLNITDGNTHQLTAYFLDWDTTARRQNIQIEDGNGNVLSIQSLVTSFHDGVYLSWNVSGHVRLRVTLAGGANPVMSGLFFDAVNNSPSSPSLTISKTHSGNFTQAQQNATYTLNISNAVGSSPTNGTVTVTETVPSGLTLVAMSGTNWSCGGNTCTRADALAGGSSYPPITVTVNVTSNATSPQVNQVSVSGGGSAVANATDPTVINLLNPPISSAAFVGVDSTTQGSWHGVYGADGYLVVGDQSSNPPYVAPAAAGQSLAVWTGSTASTRALQKPSNLSDRIAAAWYSNNSFVVDLGIADSNTHQLAAYFLDWDTMIRREKVEILDANNIVLNSQNLSSNFSGGVYLIWNVTGHVKLRVTLLSGPNPVLSGLFFDPENHPVSPLLSISKTHSGNFTAGGPNFIYLVTVSNAVNAAPTSGTVTVTETVPQGMALTLMSGIGWTCSNNTCTRSDSLASGNSYSPIFVSVSVAANASSPLVNHVSVSGGGSATATADDSTNIDGSSSSNSAASFIGTDTTTRGNWQSTYGNDGYVLVGARGVLGDAIRNPAYVTPFEIGQLEYIWASSTADQRALQDVVISGNRIAATWYSSNSFIVDLSMTDPNPHPVAAYFLDYDTTSRRQTVDVLDANDNVLNSQSLSGSFNGGIYLVWNITGHAKLRVTRTAGANAVLSGLFFGSAGNTGGSPVLSVNKTHTGNFTQGQQGATFTVAIANTGVVATNGTVTATETLPSGLSFVSMSGTGWTCALVSCSRSDALAGGNSYPPITVTVNVAANAGTPLLNQIDVTGGGSGPALASDSVVINPANQAVSSASFVKSDSTTQGNWQSVYGSDGYNIVGNQSLTPSYVSPYALQTMAIWAPSTTDTRALQKATNPADRIAATYYAPSSFTIDLNMTDANTHQLAVYALDWDTTARRETVDILDGNGNVLDSQSLTYSFHGGVYLVWSVSGHVMIRVTRTGGANAVISGLFFGGGISSPPPASASFVMLDTTTQGSWAGVYGSDGYLVVADQTSNPAYLTAASNGQNQAIWTGSTNDVRALQKPSNPSDRVAGVWYSNSSFTVDLNITDGNTHPFAVYCLDWDTTARRQTLDILDANGNVLNSQSLTSSFHGGVYVVWNIAGHVKLRVTLNAGANPVISGLFFR